jgi:hypothetical protein
VTAPMVLGRPIAASGLTISVAGVAQPARGYHWAWDHGPEGSSQTVSATIGLVAGYLKLAAQSESDDEKAIDADRRARRDRNRTLRAL